MSVGTLLAVFCFLAGRTAAVGTSDILLLLGFGLYLAIVFRLITSTSEVDTVFEYVLKVIHGLSDGRGARL